MLKFYVLQHIITMYKKIYAKLYIFTGEMFKFFIIIQIYIHVHIVQGQFWIPFNFVNL